MLTMLMQLFSYLAYTYLTLYYVTCITGLKLDLVVKILMLYTRIHICKYNHVFTRLIH